MGLILLSMAVCTAAFMAGRWLYLRREFKKPERDFRENWRHLTARRLVR